MHIWLINPPLYNRLPKSMGAVTRNLFYNSPPLGLAYLAAVLEQNDHKVTLTDCPLEGICIEDLPNLTWQLEPDLVGFTCTSAHYNQAEESARLIKSQFPNLPICIGGPHFNSDPELLIDNDAFDFAVHGEGEITLLEVIENLGAGKSVRDIPGVVTGEKGSLYYGPPRPMIEDLDTLPFPARHLLSITRYRPMPNDQYRLPKTAQIASRGCPYSCSFCSKHTFGRTYRGLSPDRLVLEMHHLKNDFGIRDIAFVDSTFAPNRKRMLAVIEAMEKNPPGVSWTFSVQADVPDEEMLRRIRALGCWRIRIAMEHANEKILARTCKGITRRDVIKTTLTADKLGFALKCFFIIGLIGETRGTIEENIRFALSMPFKDITVQLNTPLKGTPQFEQCRDHGTFIAGDTSEYSFFQPVFVPHGLTGQEMVDAQKSFYRRFYFQPRVIWKHLKSIRRLSDISKYFRALPLLASLFFRKNDGV